MAYMNMTMQMAQPIKRRGTCKKFDCSKGFGFITLSDGTGDVFVHYCEIQATGFKSLAVGESVEFEVVVQEDGRRKAINVSGPNGADVQGQQRQQSTVATKAVGRGGHGGGMSRGGFAMGATGMGMPAYGGYNNTPAQPQPQPSSYGAPYEGGYGGVYGAPAPQFAQGGCYQYQQFASQPPSQQFGAGAGQFGGRGGAPQQFGGDAAFNQQMQYY